MLFLKLFFQAAIIIFAMVGIGQWISKRAENRGPKA